MNYVNRPEVERQTWSGIIWDKLEEEKEVNMNKMHCLWILNSQKMKKLIYKHIEIQDFSMKK